MNKTGFTPFHKLPCNNAINILVVGDEGVGKHDLAKALTGEDSTCKVNVRTATKLPLPEIHSESRPRIDFVVFLADVTNRKSVKLIEEAARHLDVNYFVGRACFLITRVWHQKEKGVDDELIMELAKSYDSPLLTTDLTDSAGWKQSAKHIIKMASIAAGVGSCISPLLIGATRHAFTSM